MNRTWFAVLSVVGGCAVAPPVLADTLLVPSEYPTIQAGIDASVDGDEVVVADGTYTGPGNRDLDFGGKAITVRSENGAEACIIDLQADENDQHRAFTFDSFETPDSVVKGFTIQSGLMEYGGAVLCDFLSSPLFQSCVFRQNAAFSYGGAVFSLTGATFIGCQFLENHAGWGGAVYFFTGATPIEFIDCQFLANHAEGRGGAVSGTNRGTFIGCQFLENHADGGNGGAVFSQDSNDAAAGSNPVADFRGCLFGGNTATDPESSVGGGAVFVNDSGEFVNCTFVGNQADQGGALGAEAQSNATVVNCTFVGNQADQGGAIWRAPFFGGAEVENSILWDNSPEQIAGPVLVRYSNIQGGWEGPGEGNIDADPLFVDPDNDDLHLSPGSPCIDAGDNTAVPKGIETDYDGYDRFVDTRCTDDTGNGEPPIVDMGPHEFQVFQVTCPWDVDCNGSVGATDLLSLLVAWGPCDDCNDCPADFDGNCTVGATDLLALLVNWGPCP